MLSVGMHALITWIWGREQPTTELKTEMSHTSQILGILLAPEFRRSKKNAKQMFRTKKNGMGEIQYIPAYNYWICDIGKKCQSIMYQLWIAALLRTIPLVICILLMHIVKMQLRWWLGWFLMLNYSLIRGPLSSANAIPPRPKSAQSLVCALTATLHVPKDQPASLQTITDFLPPCCLHHGY